MLDHPFALCVGLAILLNLIIETLARQTLTGGIKFLFGSPAVFLYNSLIIFATLAISILFRRRVFYLVIVSMIWLALGITNGVILSNRMTPFTVYDFQSLKDGFSIVTNYFQPSRLYWAASAL